MNISVCPAHPPPPHSPHIAYLSQNQVIANAMLGKLHHFVTVGTSRFFYKKTVFFLFEPQFS